MDIFTKSDKSAQHCNQRNRSGRGSHSTNNNQNIPKKLRKLLKKHKSIFTDKEFK